jgi:ectoine hydroxylase-related dioxygenase (phytanoyl-CoA dioxygenase family)
MSAAVLPAATRDLARAEADLREHGVCFVADALDAEQLGRVHDALYRAADDDLRRGRHVRFGLDYAEDETNQRVWALPSRDPVFCDLVEHPAALALVKAVLGWPALCSNISANITGPGGGEMVLHADQLYMPQPWSGAQGLNVVWCVDDFTEDTGATRIVPGSHRLNRTPTEDEAASAATVPLEAPAGTMIAFEGRVWHRTGNNITADRRRAGIFAWYTGPIYRPQGNWFLLLDPMTVRYASDDLLWLFGYRAHGLGLVNGESPR